MKLSSTSLRIAASLVAVLFSLMPLVAATEELPDPNPGDQSSWNSVKNVTVGWGSIDVRYPKSQPAEVSSKAVRAYAWKGEKVSFEAVLSTPVDLSSVTMSVSDLKCGKNTISADAVSPYFVGYVMTDAYRKSDVEALSADRLFKAGSMAVEARTSRPMWLEVSVPADAPKGVYKGRLTVSYDGASKVLPFEVEVGERVLPEPSEWAFHLDLWQNPYAIARFYDVPLWSEAHFEAMRPVMEMYAAAGGKVITASIIQHPWNCQTFDPFESMIAKFRKIDGSWAYDYEVFDRWIEFAMSCGVTEQIDCYTLVPWTYRFDYYDCATNSVKYVECKPQEEAYRALILPFLKDFAAHLKAKGWFGKTCIAMDERPVEQMQAAYAVLMEADPEYRIAGAANYSIASSEAAMVYDMSVAYHYELISGPALDARKAGGQKLTIYTCCSPERPNTFTFSEPAEAAILGWHAAAVGYDGYLRWAFNSWPSDPVRDSRFYPWSAGDTYIVYPGEPSIRYMRLVEGIQDYEKIRILREAGSLTAREAAALGNLEAVLRECFAPNTFDSSADAAALLSRGKSALRPF